MILLTILHVVVAVFLILVVLLQTGKGAEMGAAFGGASNTIFGSSGPANFLAKMTTAAAVIFMITSLSLAYLAMQRKPVAAIPAPAPASAPAPVSIPAEPAAPQVPATPPATESPAGR